MPKPANNIPKMIMQPLSSLPAISPTPKPIRAAAIINRPGSHLMVRTPNILYYYMPQGG